MSSRYLRRAHALVALGLVTTALLQGPASAAETGAAGSDGGEVAAASAVEAALPANASNPAVAFDGTTFLVVWEETFPDADPYLDDAQGIYGARVSQAGVVLDRLTFAVVPVPPDDQVSRYVSTPDVAWNGQQYLVAWQYESMSNESVYGHHVDIAGQLVTKAGALSGGTLDMGHAGDFSSSPRVAPAGSEWLLTFNFVEDYLYGTPPVFMVRRFSASGAPASEPAVVAETSALSPVIIPIGAKHLIAWHAPGSGGDGSAEVFARLLDEHGTPLGAVASQLTNHPGDQFGVDAAWNGTSALLAWTDARNAGNHDVYAARMNGSGTVVGAAGGFPVARGTAIQRQATVARSGSANWLVAFAAKTTGTFDIKGQRVTATGALTGGQTTVSNAAGDQSWPEAVKGGTKTFVTWVDQRSGNADIYGANVDATGGVTPTAGVGIGIG